MKDAQANSRAGQDERPHDSGQAQSGEARRRKIAIALGRCMRAKGYAATSLTDIAIEASMSPSLMRYYFATKEEILESYYKLFSDRIMADLLRLERTSPEQWLMEFSRYTIVAGTDKPSLALLIEVFAVAVHHEPLARLKARYDSFMDRIYAEFFQWAGTAPGLAPHGAAHIARLFELGIKMNSLFSPDFEAKDAEELFLAEMRRLSGLSSSRAKALRK